MGWDGISSFELRSIIIILVISLLTMAHVLVSNRSHGVAKAGWSFTVLIFSLFGYLVFLIATQNSISLKLSRLREWYSEVTKKQRIILLVVSILLSAIPFLGWIFIAPWLLPLVVYLEYHRP